MLRHLSVALVVTIVLSALPAAAGGHGRHRDGGDRHERVQDKRDEKREERAEKREDHKKVADPGVNKRQRRQASRIVAGVRSGQLTKDEVDHLEAREASLRTLEGSMKADGQLTKDERAKLHDELDALGKEIASEKHDGDTVPALRVRDGVDGKGACEKARQLGHARRELNRADLTPEQRAALESEHERLVDDLYEEAVDGA